MRAVLEGAPRITHALAARGAGVDGGARRGRAAARASRLTGAILAGGKATRFDGRPKGLLTVGGIPIVERIHDALRAAVSPVIMIGNDPAWSWKFLRLFHDVRKMSGSLVGIHTALTWARDDVLVVAWDMPFVTPQLLQMIRDALGPGVFAAVPETPRLQPLCAAYSAACLPYLERALDAGNLRVSDFVDSLPVVRRIGVSELAAAGDPERLFFNANTPYALEIAEGMARGG